MTLVGARGDPPWGCNLAPGATCDQMHSDQLLTVLTRLGHPVAGGPGAWSKLPYGLGRLHICSGSSHHLLFHQLWVCFCPANLTAHPASPVPATLQTCQRATCKASEMITTLPPLHPKPSQMSCVNETHPGVLCNPVFGSPIIKTATSCFQWQSLEGTAVWTCGKN